MKTETFQAILDLTKEREQARRHLRIAVAALKDIASSDYRGNRSSESVRAEKALNDMAKDW